jgi:hypothetical protein
VAMFLRVLRGEEGATGQLVVSHADVMIAFVWRLEC